MKFNFNLTPEDCRFIVNEKTRTVVCIFDHCENTFINYIEHNCALGATADHKMFASNSFKLYDLLRMPNRFTGIATCSDKDEWNEKIGRAVAFSRVQRAVNKSFFKRVKTYFTFMDNALDQAEDLFNRLGVRLEKDQLSLHSHIQKLLEENNAADI